MNVKVCKLLKCEHLKGADCLADECVYPDANKELDKLRNKARRR